MFRKMEVLSNFPVPHPLPNQRNDMLLARSEHGHTAVCADLHGLQAAERIQNVFEFLGAGPDFSLAHRADTPRQCFEGVGSAKNPASSGTKRSNDGISHNGMEHHDPSGFRMIRAK